MISAKIVKVEITPIQIPLRSTFHISKGPLDTASITVVKIHTDQGPYGVGECTPFRTKYTETQEGVVAVAKKIAELLIGKNPSDINQIINEIDAHFVGPFSAKSAFDMALHDLKAKLLGIPVYQLLSGDPDKSMLTDRTVSLQSAGKMVEEALQFQEEGFTIQKIKLGTCPSRQDVARMEAIRETLGPDAILKIDANQGWNHTEARRALNDMSRLNIEYCEAPINSNHLKRLAKLTETSPIPIMGDESVYSPSDALQIVANRITDMVNIKLSKAGGIHKAGQMAAIARTQDVYCQVGCFAESRLGITALAHFATAWDNIIYFDMDSPLMHRDDPILGGITYNKDWTIQLNHEPGLGADYDPAYLSQFDAISIE